MQWNMVYHGDCDEILPQLEREGIVFDLILTDPPYNLNKDFGNASNAFCIRAFDCSAIFPFVVFIPSSMQQIVSICDTYAFPLVEHLQALYNTQQRVTSVSY